MTPRTSLLLLVLVLPASLASADAVDGPPACPPGARGRSAHEGQWCVPATCDAGCEAGERCEDRRVCVQTASVIPGGLRPTTPPPQPRELVVATCDAASACTGMEEPPPPTVGTLPTTPPTCSTMRVCVPSAWPSLPALLGAAPATGGASTPGASPAEPPRSCLCSSPGARASTPWLALLGLALALVRRRR
jgi:MYXO-CTERM domain-containing protein